VSIKSGTTLSLLKFPIVNPKPARLFERTQRLLAEKSQEVEENNLNRKSLRATGNIKYATLMGKFSSLGFGMVFQNRKEWF